MTGDNFALRTGNNNGRCTSNVVSEMLHACTLCSLLDHIGIYICVRVMFALIRVTLEYIVSHKFTLYSRICTLVYMYVVTKPSKYMCIIAVFCCYEGNTYPALNLL